MDKGKSVEPSVNANQHPPIDPKDKGKSAVEPAASAQDSGKLDEGDAASFADLPTEDVNNNDEMVGEESSEPPTTKLESQQPS
ncbi:hypothetical protein HRI_002261400 [Hibiscus trionum]|uniref:Uncharacterized protein n=1 Tax=Hibiscus trionum TaxID=183268 RepID=A0A9W7HYX5_HIBTR|nr:hypothetical protein HRI_002261400 [Hibiscus trionum]